MKKVAALLILLFIFFTLKASAQETESVSVDTITKIFSVFGMLLGLFIGYMQILMKNKISDVEAKIYSKVDIVEDRLESKFQIALKEMENKMATKTDILQTEKIVSLQLRNIEIQLESAKAALLKKETEVKA